MELRRARSRPGPAARSSSAGTRRRPRRSSGPSAWRVATATADGAPSVRMVLLKSFDERGLVFFTHCDEPQGPRARPRTRGRRCSSTGTRSAGRCGSRAPSSAVSAEESDAYFADAPARRAGRARTRRGRARCSPAATSSRQRVAELERRRGRSPRPETWGGFRARPGDVGVLAAPRRPPARPLPLPARRRRLGHRAALPLASACGRASRAGRPTRRRPRPSTRPRRRAARASPRSASRGPRASRAAAPRRRAPTSCFATACRVTGSSAASSVAVALPRAATASTSERRPGSPSAAKTSSTRRRSPRERAQLERRAPVRRRLDDAHARAALDLLELEDDLAARRPSRARAARPGSASRTTARRSSPSPQRNTPSPPGRASSSTSVANHSSSRSGSVSASQTSSGDAGNTISRSICTAAPLA